MARRRKVLPARKPRNGSRDDDALLLRSAETLGRMIGALQRQLDDATRRLTGNGARSAATNGPTNGGSSAKSATRKKKKSARKPTATKAAMIATQKRRSRPKSTRRTAKPR